jgi:ABC-2 type transport system permease protein
MRNVLIVMKHEIATTMGKRSFWFFTFVFPLLILAFSLLPQVLAANAFAPQPVTGPAAAGQAPLALAYVDEAGIVKQLPPGLSDQQLRAFPDVAAADAALGRGEIERYMVIPADYLSTGQWVLVSQRASPVDTPPQLTALEYTINYNLTGSADLATLLVDPTPSIIGQAVAPSENQPTNNPESALGFAIPFAVMFVLFFVITMSAGYMLQSVAQEKENRTAEVLLVSLRPRELMLGKVVGLGAVALLQMVIWLGGGTFMMGRSAQLFPGAGSYQLPPTFLPWAIAYFLLGYLVYAAMLGALGALAPNVREGSQFTFVLLLPLLVPLWLNTFFVQDPNGPAATFLSLFPLTAPTSMVTRLAAGGVPPWQPVAGIMLLLATAYVLVLLAARFFRADTLLSSESLSWGRIRQELHSSAH